MRREKNMSGLEKIVLAATVGVLVFVATRGESAPLPSYSAGLGVRVALAGDSYMAGAISDDIIRINAEPGEDLRCWRSMCMAAIISSYLEEHTSASGRTVNTKNVGAGGSNSRDWSPNDFNVDDPHWRQYNAPLFDRIPAANVVVVHLGGNDVTGVFDSGPVGLLEWRRNISQIVDTLTSRGVEHVVLVGTVTPPDWWCSSEFAVNPRPDLAAFGCAHRDIREATEDYVELRNYWAERGAGGFRGTVSYLDTAVTRQLQNQRGYWDGTGNVHPTINGHYWIGRAIAQHLYEDVLGLGEAPPVVHPMYPWISN